jgi:DUF2975 family protein
LSPSRPSGAARTGYVLVTLLLALGIGFGTFLALDAGVGAVRGGDRLVSGRNLDVHVQLPPERVRLPEGIRHSGWLPVTVQIHDPTATQILLSFGMDLSQVVLFVAVLWLLRGIARSVREGDPFVPSNVRRLRAIGFWLVLGGIAVEVVNASLRTALYDRLPATFGNIGTEGFNIPGNFLLAGLGAFILAEVFAHGLRLREDVEGTV